MLYEVITWLINKPEIIDIAAVVRHHDHLLNRTQGIVARRVFRLPAVQGQGIGGNVVCRGVINAGSHI